MRNLRWLIAVLAAVALAPAGVAAQQGTITGQVVDETTRQPLADVQIFVEGTTRGTLTNAQGRYQLVGIPVGIATLRATRIGYNQSQQQVTVEAGAPVVANFTLNPAAVELGAVVVTATGQRQAVRELGNSVSTINVDEEVPLAGVNDISQALQARSPGVTVLQSSGTSGTGARIRIRGSASVSLDNDPLLIIDGVRADNSSTYSLGLGGQTTNRLNDINPESIESMEILKGPAASALYGTAAANGVIVITTKQGTAGEARWSAYTEQGTLHEITDYPTTYTGIDTDNPFGLNAFCLTYYQALGFCELDEIQQFNPLEDPRTTPFQDGNRQKYGVNVSGGNDQLTYFLSGDFEDEEGIYRHDLNWLERINLRANTRLQVTPRLDVGINTGYVASESRLPQNDNNIFGILSGGLLSYTSQYDPDDPACGYYYLCPEDVAAFDSRQDVDRVTGSVNTNWRPLSWLTLVGTAGMDVVNRFDNETLPPERVYYATLAEGARTSNRVRVANYTANAGGITQYDFNESIRGSTSAGVQYTEEIARGTYAYGEGLLRGAGSLAAVATRLAVDEVNTQVRTIGGYLEQQVVFGERLYLTGAVRADDNSAFGNDFGLVAYPSLSASWVVFEEPWFPQTPLISSLRLRSAFGRSGLRPEFRDALRYLSPTVTTVRGSSVPTYQFGGVGNLNLKPEISTEFEVGFDAGLLGDRLGVEFTYYNKKSEDALVSRRLAPSLGASSTQFVNLGEVQNRGAEVLLNASLVETQPFQLETTLSGAWTKNELVELGIDPATGDEIAPIIFGLGGNTQRHQEGFPLGAYFARPILGYEDANEDGILGPDEVEVGDTAVYLGNPFPTRELSFSSTATLFNLIRVQGLLDYRGGYELFNSTREFRCGTFGTCREAVDPSAPLADQAAFIGAFEYLTAAGYIEEADFLKLREVSVTLMAPERWATRAGVAGLSLSLAGRNLATWTDYTGFDPEVNFAGSASNFSTADFLTQPPLRYYTARVDVRF